MAVNRNSKTGLWEVQVWYRTHDGRRKKKHKRGFRTKAVAKQWEREFLLRAEGSPSMKFADFVEVYMADMKPQLKLNTFLTKGHIIKTKLVPFFGEMQLDEIQAADIMRWQNELRSAVNPRTGRPYAASYLRTVRNQCSSLFNHGVRYYGLRENPFAKTGKAPKAHEPEMQIWTTEEYLRFSDAIMDKPRSHMAFEILYWAGVREGELLALTPSDFDLKRCQLRISKSYQRIKGEDVITPPKTPKSVRTISIPEFLVAEVGEYIELFGIADDERLFPVSKSYLYHEMSRGCKMSGVKRIRVHDLRHSAVSLLISLGFSAVGVADRMGHESIDITYRYAHLFPSAQDDMARALDKVGGGNDE